MRPASLRLCLALLLLGGCASDPKPVAVRHRTHAPPGEAQHASYPPAPVGERTAPQTAAQPADCVPATPGINAAQEDDLFRRFDQTRAQAADDAPVAR